MKEDEIWTSIVTCLKAANDAATWAFWRERFNTNHPEHVRQQEIENPSRYAYANWTTAKHLYVKNKEQMDKHCNYLMHDCEPFPGISNQVEFFIAMRKTVEKEMEEEFENQFLKEEAMGLKTKWNNDEYLLDDEEIVEAESQELDEDEEYLRETEKSSIDPDDEDDSYDPYEEDEEF
jgi:hypothetical protein